MVILNPFSKNMLPNLFGMPRGECLFFMLDVWKVIKRVNTLSF